MPKKYNSVLSICFSVEHDNRDGSDLTPDDIHSALCSRIRGMDSQEAWESATGCFHPLPLEDTVENY